MPRKYYIINFEDGSPLITTSSHVVEKAKKLGGVTSIISRTLTTKGWKEVTIKKQTSNIPLK